MESTAALHSSSSHHIQTLIPVTAKQPSSSSPFNNIKFNYNNNNNHFRNPKINFNLRISKRYKLRCSINAGSELDEPLDPEKSETTISVPSETVEMVDPPSGSLANQGLWEQMVEIVKFSGPATGIWICGPLMSLIDTAVIGQGSSLELAALGETTRLDSNKVYLDRCTRGSHPRERLL